MVTVNNIDIVDLMNRCWVFRTEVLETAKRGSHSVSNPMQNRIKEMISALDAQVRHILNVKFEDIDMVYTMDVEWPVQEFLPTVGAPVPENAALAQVVRIFDVIGMDLSKCGSRKEAAGLKPADANRLKMNIDKLRDYVENYIDTTHPIDVPFVEQLEDYQPGSKE